MTVLKLVDYIVSEIFQEGVIFFCSNSGDLFLFLPVRRGLLLALL